MRIWPFLTLISAIACGDDLASPTTPPIAEWCDVDRPREDCRADSIFINDGNLEMAKALCSTPCTKIKSLSFGGADSEMLKAVKGFTQIDGLTVLASRADVRDLKAFKDLTSSSFIEIDGNANLESLAGLENLVRVAPPEDSEFERTGDNKFEISGNPKLKSVSALRSLQVVGNIQIYNNGALETIEGINALTLGGIRVESNRELKKISGFEGMETRGSLTILANRNLEVIDGFPNLKQADYIQVLRNRALDECQIQRIVEQLDTPPQTLELSDNKKQCD